MTQPVDLQAYLQQTFNAMPQPARPVAPPPMTPMPPVAAAPAPAPEPAPAGPPPPPPNVEAAPVSQPQGVAPAIPERTFPLKLVGGGGPVRIPEREVDMRGPTLRSAQDMAMAGNLNATRAIADRSQQAAALEYNIFLDQQRQAEARQAAMDKAAAEREAEMQERLRDFDSSVKAMSQASVDPNRFWSTRSTGQKVAGILSVALGGFLQGARGGSNAGLDILNDAIEKDIKAQEFEYLSRRNQTDGKQTAFSMAMQKYQNVDAAKAMARAAAMDAAAARVGQMRALYAGTEAANRADATIAGLMDRKKDEIQQGIRFLPSQVVQQAPVFVDPRTGITYTNREAQGVAEKFDAAENKREEIGLQTAGKVIEEQVKAGAAKAVDGEKNLVVLPNGDTVKAPDVTEAGHLRELSTTSMDVDRLVKRAKEIRSSTGWRASPEARYELDSIQQQLRTSFSVAQRLGALSKDDIKIADGAVGDLMAYGSSPERALEAYKQKVNQAWRIRTKTYANAPDTAKGVMPASFKPAGGK